jgi:hypothetical protein
MITSEDIAELQMPSISAPKGQPSHDNRLIDHRLPDKVVVSLLYRLLLPPAVQSRGICATTFIAPARV